MCSAKDCHRAQNILSKNQLCSRHNMIITPTLPDDSPPMVADPQFRAGNNTDLLSTG